MIFQLSPPPPETLTTLPGPNYHDIFTYLKIKVAARCTCLCTAVDAQEQIVLRLGLHVGEQVLRPGQVQLVPLST